MERRRVMWAPLGVHARRADTPEPWCLPTARTGWQSAVVLPNNAVDHVPTNGLICPAAQIHRSQLNGNARSLGLRNVGQHAVRAALLQPAEEGADLGLFRRRDKVPERHAQILLARAAKQGAGGVIRTEAVRIPVKVPDPVRGAVQRTVVAVLRARRASSIRVRSVMCLGRRGTPAGASSPGAARLSQAQTRSSPDLARRQRMPRAVSSVAIRSKCLARSACYAGVTNSQRLRPFRRPASASNDCSAA